MILDEFVEVNVSGRTKQHYINLGYKIPTHIGRNGKEAVKNGTTIMVRPTDLPDNSAIKITVQCDNPKCQCVKQVHYYTYKNSVDRFGEYYCASCGWINQHKAIKEKYGVDNPSQIESVKQKKRETCLERYGIPAPVLSPEARKNSIEQNKKVGLAKRKLTMEQKYEEAGGREEYYRQVAEKSKETNLLHLGVEWPTQSKEVRDKIKASLMERYGVEHPAQNPEFVEQMKQTNLEKYGYTCNFSDPQFRKQQEPKIRESLFKNGTAPSSRQQRYIANLYNGKVNYPLDCYSLDIFDESASICIEYNGGGHDLCVKFDEKTQEEFDRNEILRDKYIRSKEIKLVKLISPHDKLPSDNKLLEIYDFAKNYFETTDHTWINFYIEENKYRNAEHRDDSGAFYDFGELWNGRYLAKKMKGVSNET